MAAHGIRCSITSGAGDGQIRLTWHAWRDGRWERLAVQAEVDDGPAADRIPAAVAEILGMWLKAGDLVLIDMQEADGP